MALNMGGQSFGLTAKIDAALSRDAERQITKDVEGAIGDAESTVEAGFEGRTAGGGIRGRGGGFTTGAGIGAGANGAARGALSRLGGATAGVSTAAASFALPVALTGTVAFGILKATEQLAKVSPALEAVGGMVETAAQVAFQPAGRKLAQILLPAAEMMLESATKFAENADVDEMSFQELLSGGLDATLGPLLDAMEDAESPFVKGAIGGLGGKALSKALGIPGLGVAGATAGVLSGLLGKIFGPDVVEEGITKPITDKLTNLLQKGWNEMGGWPNIGELWPGWPDVKVEWNGWPDVGELWDSAGGWPDVGGLWSQVGGWPDVGNLWDQVGGWPNVGNLWNTMGGWPDVKMLWGGWPNVKELWNGWPNVDLPDNFWPSLSSNSIIGEVFPSGMTIQDILKFLRGGGDGNDNNDGNGDGNGNLVPPDPCAGVNCPGTQECIEGRCVETDPGDERRRGRRAAPRPTTFDSTGSDSSLSVTLQTSKRRLGETTRDEDNLKLDRTTTT